MNPDLLNEVIDALQAQKGSWKAIADELSPEVSYSFVSQLGRGKYKSHPSYKKLRLLADHLHIRAAA